jgi:hypothetical protein
MLPTGRAGGNLTRVDSREFRRLRAGLVSNLPPASGDLLESAASELRRRLTSSAMFAAVSVETTEDPDRLIAARLRYQPGTSVAQVSSYLEAVWVAELRLDGLDAFHFVTGEGNVELESVTGDAASGYFITLHLTADEGTVHDFESRPTQTTADEDAPTKRRWFRR